MIRDTISKFSGFLWGALFMAGVLGLVGAFGYMDQHGKLTLERQAHGRTKTELTGALGWAGRVCSAVGRDLGDKPDVKTPIGTACLARVQWLAGFYTQSTSETARAIASAQTETLKRQAAELASLRTRVATSDANLRRLKEARAHDQGDYASRDYLRRLNDTAGLPTPGDPGDAGADPAPR